jgi:hypothetical protein
MRAARATSPWPLASARAVAIVRALVALGVQDTRLSAVARSSAHASGAAAGSGGGRVDIVVRPRPDELPDLSSLAEPGTDATAPAASGGDATPVLKLAPVPAK